MIIDQLFTPGPLKEGGPYDLPGIDYPRPGDTPLKRPSGEQNPYPYSPEEDDDYFREIFRKKREAAKKAEQDKEQGIAEGLAQDEAEEDSGWRAELVNEINYNTFEVKVTNARSKESANFIIRPVDMISIGPTLDIETMDVRDLQTGQTESWTKDDPAPDGPIANAIGSLFYDDKQLQKKLWNIVDTHDTKGQDMMPGLEKRRSIGQEVDADAYIDSGEKTQAAMAKMKKGVAEGTRERLSNLHDKIRKEKGLPDPKEYLKIAQQKKKEIADLKAQDKKDPDIKEGMFGSRSSPVIPIVDKISKVARELTPQNVEVGKQIIQSKINEITRMLSPQVQSGVDVIEQDMEEGLGYSQDPAQAKWYHEGRRAFKGGTTGNLIQDIARKHNCPPEWLDAFRAGYKDQQGFAKDDVTENAQKSMPFYGTNPATGQARTYDELLSKSQAGAAPATPNFAPKGGGYKSMNPSINLPNPTAAPATAANMAQTKKTKKSSSDSFTPDEISMMSPFVQKQLSGIKEALAQPVAELLQMVETKEDVQRIKQFVDDTFVKYGAVNESAFVLRNQILEHVTQAGAQRRREYSQRVAH